VTGNAFLERSARPGGEQAAGIHEHRPPAVHDTVTISSGVVAPADALRAYSRQRVGWLRSCRHHLDEIARLNATGRRRRAAKVACSTSL